MLTLLAILAAAAGYVLLKMWLPNVAKKDMDRRGQPGWAYDTAVWLILPIGLLAWWRARRRYPILDDELLENVERRSS